MKNLIIIILLVVCVMLGLEARIEHGIKSRTVTGLETLKGSVEVLGMDVGKLVAENQELKASLTEAQKVLLTKISPEYYEKNKLDIHVNAKIASDLAEYAFKLGIDCGAQAICEAQRDCCEEQLPWAAKWSIDPDSIYLRAAEIRKDPDLVFHLQPGRIVRVLPNTK